MNNIDRTKKIPLTMEEAKEVLEFLDLKLKFDKERTYFAAPAFLRTALQTFLKVLHYD